MSSPPLPSPRSIVPPKTARSTTVAGPPSRAAAATAEAAAALLRPLPPHPRPRGVSHLARRAVSSGRWTSAAAAAPRRAPRAPFHAYANRQAAAASAAGAGGGKGEDSDSSDSGSSDSDSSDDEGSDSDSDSDSDETEVADRAKGTAGGKGGGRASGRERAGGKGADGVRGAGGDGDGEEEEEGWGADYRSGVGSEMFEEGDVEAGETLRSMYDFVDDLVETQHVPTIRDPFDHKGRFYRRVESSGAGSDRAVRASVRVAPFNRMPYVRGGRD